MSFPEWLSEARKKNCSVRAPYPGFPFCPPNQGFYTPTRLSAHQISSSHIVPLPAEAAVDVEPTHASAFRAFLRHRSTLMLFLRRSSAVSGRPLSSRHWQRPDPPQHVAEQPTGQMPFCQQEPVRSAKLAPSAACGNSCVRNAKFAETSMPAQRSPRKARDCREAKRVSSSAMCARWLAFCCSTDSTMVAKRCWRLRGGFVSRMLFTSLKFRPALTPSRLSRLN